MRGTTVSCFQQGFTNMRSWLPLGMDNPGKQSKFSNGDHLTIPTLSVIMGFCAMDTRALASKLAHTPVFPVPRLVYWHLFDCGPGPEPTLVSTVIKCTVGHPRVLAKALKQVPSALTKQLSF